jgi:hypothetical protein
MRRDWPVQRGPAARRVLVGVALVIVLALVSFALATFRTLERGQAEMHESDAAFDRGELELALLHARRAALLYVPGARHVGSAYERLRAIATGAERAREPALAAGAWQAVRAAALETAHVWQPHGDELGEANHHLDRLLASPPGSTTFSDAPPKSARAAGWTFLLVVGFGGAVVGAVSTVWRGLRPSGEWAFGRARLPLALALLGVLCSVLALLQA